MTVPVLHAAGSILIVKQLTLPARKTSPATPNLIATEYNTHVLQTLLAILTLIVRQAGAVILIVWLTLLALQTLIA